MLEIWIIGGRHEQVNSFFPNERLRFVSSQLQAVMREMGERTVVSL
jgi:hypothetical protein